jgi:hypothetical protein
MQTIRPASHTTALGGLFIAEVWAVVQQEVCVVEELTDLIPSAKGARANEHRPSPLRGLLGSVALTQRLAPWAAFYRRFAAGVGRLRLRVSRQSSFLLVSSSSCFLQRNSRF